VFYVVYGYKHSRLRRGIPPGTRPPDFNPEQQLPESDIKK
jgi:hypothetical protein